MKKVISIVSLFIIISVLAFGLSFGKAGAQNVGSLRSIVTPSFSFDKDLRFGDVDLDVMELQKILNADPDTVVALSDTGSKGHENTIFGASTKAAVIKFQNKYSDTVLAPAGLTTGSGFVGKLTRTRLNLLIGVVDTLDSVGLPASTVVPGVVTNPTSTPTPINSGVTSSAPQMSTCQFVDLLINIGAISPDKAGPARLAVNCSGASTCQLVNLLINIGAIYPDKANTARSVTNCSSSNPNDYGNYGNNNYSNTGSSVVNNYYYPNNSGTSTSTSGTNSSNTNNSGNLTSTPGTNPTNSGLTNSAQALNVTCTATPYPVALNTPTKWVAVAAGGAGNYTYSWSGDDGLTSTSSSFFKSYSTNGYKYAAVRVTSNSTIVTANCRAFVGDLSMASTSDVAISLDGTSTSTCNGKGPSDDSNSNSDDDNSLSDFSLSLIGTLFAGQVVSPIKCITSYYPYREDSSIRQVLISPCAGSAGQSTGYLIIPVADVPNTGKTVLGRATPTISNCLNPPGTLLGKPTGFRVGDSCTSTSGSTSTN